MTEITPEQIESKAREIGSRPYHPTDDYYHFGISVRQELMRTAMGACQGAFNIDWCINVTNALLIQMAKDELGVK